MFNGKDEEGD